MHDPVRHRTVLPPDLEAEVVTLLRDNRRESRLRAIQLLAQGWAQDEEARLASLPPHERPDAVDPSGRGDGEE